MKKILAISLLFVLLFGLTACGSSDSLKGTWAGTYEDGEATWVFDGKDKCEMTNVFGGPNKGTYTIKEKDVEIKLDVWEKATVYHFTIDGDKLTLTADDVYSPNYELTKDK